MEGLGLEVQGVSDTDSRPIDLSLVVGGFNSSNTTHLQEITVEKGIPSYHIDQPSRINFDEHTIIHKPLSTSLKDAMAEKGLLEEKNWLPAGKIVVGVTSGASTPDNVLGEAIFNLITSHNLQK